MYLPYLKRLVDLQSWNLKPKKWQSPPSALNGSFNCSIYWMHWLTKLISNYADCVFMFFTIIHIWQIKLIWAIHCITSANDIFPHYYKIDVGCIGGSLTVYIGWLFWFGVNENWVIPLANLRVCCTICLHFQIVHGSARKVFIFFFYVALALIFYLHFKYA